MAENQETQQSIKEVLKQNFPVFHNDQLLDRIAKEARVFHIEPLEVILHEGRLHSMSNRRSHVDR